jgi:exodeoxyribonuclease VIII
VNTGVYENLSFSDYCAIDAVNNTRLGRMAKSPRHYQTPLHISTPSLVFGNLAHTGRLEPTSLAERYAVAADWHLDPGNVTATGRTTDSKATRYYKERLADFTSANAGREIVTREAYERMKAVVASIDADRTARELFAEPGPCELTLVWDDPETGLLCKGRIDKVAAESGRMADLKTSRDIDKFAKSMHAYAYHRQQAFYREGWAVLCGGELLEPWIVAVETELPHTVLAAPLGETTLAQGEREFRDLLRRVADCHEAGAWPAMRAPDAWELPEWAINEEPVAITVGGVTMSV